MLYEVYASPEAFQVHWTGPSMKAGRPGRFWSSAQYERDPLQRRGVKFQRSVADATDQNGIGSGQSSRYCSHSPCSYVTALKKPVLSQRISKTFRPWAWTSISEKCVGSID